MNRRGAVISVIIFALGLGRPKAQTADPYLSESFAITPTWLNFLDLHVNLQPNAKLVVQIGDETVTITGAEILAALKGP